MNGAIAYSQRVKVSKRFYLKDTQNTCTHKTNESKQTSGQQTLIIYEPNRQIFTSAIFHLSKESFQ